MGIILCTLSHVMHISEKFVLCLAAVGVVSCLVFTFTMMLVLGIGLGYNYCFVDFKTRHKYVPGYYRYTVLPSTTTYKTIQYRRPYPTLYPPQNEWFQIGTRRSNIDNERETFEFNMEDLNGTDFEKLNASLDVNGLSLLLKEMQYNNTLPEGVADYYGNVDAESRSIKEETSNMTTPMSIVSPTSTPIKTLLLMTLKSTAKPMPIPLTSPPAPSTQSDTLTSVTPVRLQAHPSENGIETVSNHTKTVLHLNGLDLFALLAKLKTENKNYTVKIETN